MILGKPSYKLYVGSPATETIWDCSRAETCKIDNIYYGSHSVFCAVIRMMTARFIPSLSRIWIKTKPEEDDTYSTIVFMDSCHSLPALKYHIMAKKESQRYIFYYWNLVSKCPIKPDEVKEMGYEVYSFDEGDCEKYDLHYNPSFYFESWYEGLNTTPENADVSFVGRDKAGRADMVAEIMKTLRDYNLKTCTYFTAPKWYKRFSDKRYGKYLNFKDMIKQELKCRAVLDVAFEDQKGITLRVFDALCNGRKLITQNKNILNMDIYNPNNVFVLGVDNIKDIGNFIERECNFNDKISGYEFSRWINRFYEEAQDNRG